MRPAPGALLLASASREDTLAQLGHSWRALTRRDHACAPKGAVALRASRSAGRRSDQLQTWQRPAAHEHVGTGGAMRRGPQRRTHSRAADSLRSLAPPGQQRRSIVEMSCEVAGSDRAEIDLMCVSMRGSAKPSAIAYRDTRRGGGSAESGLPVPREPAWRAHRNLGSPCQVA